MNTTKMKKSVNSQYIMADFPEFSKITDEVIEKNRNRRFTGGVRIQHGMYRTAEESDKYIRKSLERTLP